MTFELYLFCYLTGWRAKNEEFTFFSQRENQGSRHDKGKDWVLVLRVGLVSVHFVPGNQLVRRLKGSINEACLSGFDARDLFGDKA